MDQKRNKPLVSIVTPNYNSGDFIKRSIESILGQSYENWELHIVDDSSSDKSKTIAKEFSSSDSRIYFSQNKLNLGAAKSRNIGIENAKGDFIAFLDSDDIWHENKLEVQLAFMISENVNFSYTAYHRIDEEDNPMGIFEPENVLGYTDLLKENQIGCLTAVYNCKALGKHYMPDIRKRQDFGLWLNILKSPLVGKAHKVPYHMPLSTYRVRKKSVSSDKFGLLKYNWQLLRNHQELSLIKSSFYLGYQVYRKIF